MKVKLIQITQNPIEVMWTAARTCYSAKSPVEMWENDAFPNDGENISWEEQNAINEKHWNLVKKVLDSGHQSVAEHVYFTFAIEGISRACSHQLVRHRAGIVFSQQSQRYCKPSNREKVSDILDLRQHSAYNVLQERYNMTAEQADNYILELLDKYFVIPDKLKVDPEFQSFDGSIMTQLRTQLLECFEQYLHFLNMGMESEDARNVLPNATKTNITMSVNYRELIHLCNLRLCTRAQLEIRNLFKEIVKCVKEKDERLASYLVPQCEVHGACFEDKCCGRKPKFEDLLHEKDDMFQTILSKVDMEKIFQTEDNPEKIEQLKKLMEMKSVLE